MTNAGTNVDSILDECMMQIWYETLDDACKEHRGKCEECPLQCHEEPPELDW